ncbi:MBL fold metallo-hydrolase [uncultured Marinococcus sp.]|uniref:MBL fold metallo-hydrolase n=1 Tax=uncultured Marinococcus sp. TaxID=487012 RepID=UPI0026140C17|nr:MBL fold metallo-hydrolase [uncultured Marinococcus sp.]
MKVTIIGFWHAFPEAGEAASGYLLEEDGFELLLDCGSGVISQLQHYTELSSIDAVLLSHYHQDHVGDFGAFQYYRLLEPVLWPKKQHEMAVYAHREDEEGFQRLFYKEAVQPIEYRAQEPFTAGPFTITPVPVKHAVPCFGFRIETAAGSLFFTADTSYMPELEQAAAQVDVLLAESSFYAGQDGSFAGHMNSEEAAILANNAEAGKLILTHLPHFGDHAQLKREAENIFPGPVEPAAGGLKINISRDS